VSANRSGVIWQMLIGGIVSRRFRRFFSAVPGAARVSAPVAPCGFVSSALNNLSQGVVRRMREADRVLRRSLSRDSGLKRSDVPGVTGGCWKCAAWASTSATRNSARPNGQAFRYRAA
jgi:hypothetical protein